MHDKDCIICLLVFCCLSGVCLGLQVRQSHSDLITKPGDTVQIFCSHDKTDYRVMLWYQRPPGDTAMKLIGHLYSKAVTMEDPYKESFNISGDLSGTTAKNGSLIIKAVGQEDSAVYYCAARGSGTGSEAYFGGGTKLTVLAKDSEIKPPTVEVLPPSTKECQNKIETKKRKKTLVCVISGFYPDHVRVHWEIGNEERKKGVATDNMPAQPNDERFYKITSRLKVDAKEWFNPDNEFHCIASFFNGTVTANYTDSINGIKALNTGKNITTEDYLKRSQAAKLTYGVLIVKGCIYGAFVMFLVWKLPGSSGKRNN